MRSCHRGQTSILERQPVYVGDGGKEPFSRLADFSGAWLANSLLPAESKPLITEMQRTAGEEVPVSVFGASSDPEGVEVYARLGVERILPNPLTLLEAEALRKLAVLAGLAGKV